MRLATSYIENSGYHSGCHYEYSALKEVIEPMEFKARSKFGFILISGQLVYNLWSYLLLFYLSEICNH